MSGNNEISNDGGGGGVVETGDQVQANPEQQRVLFLNTIEPPLSICFHGENTLAADFMSGRSGNIGYNNTGVSNRGASLPSRNLFQPGQKFDLYIYLSDSKIFSRIGSMNLMTKVHYFWKETGLTYSDWTSGPDGDGSRTKSATFPTPKSLANNGSLYIHVFIVKKDQSPDRKSRHHVKREVLYNVRQLNKYKKKYYKKTQKSAYWQNRGRPRKNKRRLNSQSGMPPNILFKWQLYASQQMRGKWSQMFGGELFEDGDDDQDSIKQALLETSPLLLG
uniref:CP2 domain-containing protein n=1 Tax=Loa loa TaxID=7209 RepID=A0A1I7V7D4_LOALO